MVVPRIWNVYLHQENALSDGPVLSQNDIGSVENLDYKH